MLLQIKRNIITLSIVTFFILSIKVQAQVIDTNKIIDTNDKGQVIQIQNDSLELDSLNQNPNELSFYEEYIEPIIAVVSTALITILLFSVRSKK